MDAKLKKQLLLDIERVAAKVGKEPGNATLLSVRRDALDRGLSIVDVGAATVRGWKRYELRAGRCA